MRAHEFITELTGIKNAVAQLGTGSRHQDWEKMLSNYGFTAIGRGIRGQVYSNPKFNYILKVFKKTDKAYQDWYKVCNNQLKGNPYVPVFRGGIVQLTPDVLAVRIETLQPATNDQINLTRKIAGMLSDENQKNWISSNFASTLDDDLIELISWLELLVSPKYNYELDLHKGNVMSRQSGQLVFIDPIG